MYFVPMAKREANWGTANPFLSRPVGVKILDRGQLSLPDPFIHVAYLKRE